MKTYPVKVQIRIALADGKSYFQIHNAIPVVAGCRKMAVEMAHLLYTEEDGSALVVAVGEGTEILVHPAERKAPTDQWKAEWLQTHQAS